MEEENIQLKGKRIGWIRAQEKCENELSLIHQSDQEARPIRQSELPRPIPSNSVESDVGCTSRINLDNVTLALHNMTLTWKIIDPDQLASEKPTYMDLDCFQNSACPSSKLDTISISILDRKYV